MKLLNSTYIRAGNKKNRVNLSGSDQISSNIGVPMILFFEERIDEQAIHNALMEILPEWYVFAGRIKRGKDNKPYIDCNDAGMLLETYEHRMEMPHPNIDTPLRGALRKFHKVIMPWQVENKDQPVCVIQLHHFVNDANENRGSIFSITTCHTVADGWGMWVFTEAISQSIQGKSRQKPNHDRSSIKEIAQQHMETLAEAGRKPNSPRLSDANLLQKGIFTLRVLKNVIFTKPNELFLLTADKIESIRSSQPDKRLSRQDIAIGVIAKAMQLESVGALYNMRLDKEFSVPQNFSGNALVYREFNMSESPDNDKSIAWYAQKWREANHSDDSLDVMQYIVHLEDRYDAGLIKNVLPLNLFTIFDKGILINNYSVFPIYNVDFGGGPAFWYEMLPLPFRGALITNTPKNDGGMILNLTADQWQLDNVRRLLRD